MLKAVFSFSQGFKATIGLISKTLKYLKVLFFNFKIYILVFIQQVIMFLTHEPLCIL